MITRTFHAHRLLVALAIAAAGLARAAVPAHAAAGDVEFFEKKIRPLLSEHCYKCHSDGAKRLKGNLHLDHADGVLKGGDTGPAVVPGDVEKSLLIRAVRYKDQELQMPPDGKLSDVQIADLEHWVRSGAADPRRGKPVPAASGESSGGGGGSAGGVNLDEGRKWWAFQPVKDSPAPNVKRTDWVRAPLDRFVLAKLDEKGFPPAKQADRRMLIRRAYYDLIGLPPTPDEVERFVNDPAPDAFATVVEHLLALPQYGERWGRHWLDVVRYTDSFDGRILGNQFDAAFAWRYRDWVVDAFNADLPYDQFVKDQIAGDLRPGPKPGAMNKSGTVATGVYYLGEWGGGDADKEKLVTDIVDDQVDLTGRAFLGLTIACARCHDHKFDPISTGDYYGLAGVFHSTHVLSDPGPKGGSPTGVRVQLADKAELDKRKADEARVAQIAQQTDRIIDDNVARLAREMLPKVDEYLAAAWEYKNTPEPVRPTPAAFARQRSLNGYELTQWLGYVGMPSLKLFPKAANNVGGMPGVSGWRTADDADTPVVWANASDKTVQLLPGLMLPAKSISMHPSPAAGVAVAWRSPIAGRVKITGKVVDGHAACGDGIAWSVSRFGGGSSAGELASGTIANGGTQALAAGTGGKSLTSVEVAEGEMLQLAILPKAEHGCDTTNVELTITEVGASGRTWDLIDDVAATLTAGNPHPDSHGNAAVWHFHDMAGQARATFAAGSVMSRFAASVSAAAGTDGGAVRAAAAEVRKSLEAVAAEADRLKAEGGDAGSVTMPDASLYQTLTAPRGAFWLAARADDSLLPEDARQHVTAMLSESAALQQSLAQPVPMAHAMQEGGTKPGMFPSVQDVPVHVRGSYTRLGEVIPRRFPQVVAGTDQPRITQGSGRKELSEWIASPANPLTARVMANRIWQGHFGEGIVRTANNFGKLGTPPTHPDLLDHLATRLVQLGWSMKALHREIMLSATYQQSSTADPATAKADPDNLLLGRQNRQRLDAEGLRDSLLFVTGRLDQTLGGVSINDLNTPRRTLYVTTIRSDRATYRNLFDAADASAIVEKRVDSTVAPQALFLLNNPFVLAQTKLLAERVLKEGGADESSKIDWLYRTLFSRPPTAREQEIAAAGLADVRQSQPGEAVPPELPWEAYCQVLLCTNEFMYVD